MIELGWSAPLKKVDARTARRGILWQHQRIREFLERARAIADAALDGDPISSDAVPSLIGDLHSTLEVHTAFEESVLLPLLSDDAEGGWERADRLLEEHRRQRGMLAAIHREAVAHPELPTLAAKLAFLTSWLLTDMAEEERCLLSSDRDADATARAPTGGGRAACTGR
jgi:hypothetical protein